MRFLFLTKRGNMFEMEADTLQEMKEKVEWHIGIPVSKQTLTFKGNILRSDLDCVGINNGSIVNLHIAADYDDRPWPRHIFLRMPPPWSSFNLEHFPINQTVERLKKKIQEMVADSPLMGHIVVIKNYQTGIELPDHATLFECQILVSPEVTVEFRSQMVLNVNFTGFGEGRSITVGVNDVIGSVRGKIQLELLQRGIGIPPPSILLKDERGMLLPDDRTVFQCQIRENSTLTVDFRRKMNVVAHFPGAGLSPVTVGNLTSLNMIEKVKERLATTWGIPKERMVVREEENGEELPNEKRLLNCKISFSVEILPPIPPPSGQE